MRISDSLAVALFGRTQEEAYAANICIDCGELQPPKQAHEPKLTATEMRRYLYRMSALCPHCYRGVVNDAQTYADDARYNQPSGALGRDSGEGRSDRGLGQDGDDTISTEQAADQQPTSRGTDQ